MKNKTNAMRYLDKLHILYEVIEYKTEDGQIDGISVANKIGYDMKNVYKTLVSRGKDIVVVVIPVHKEVNLKKLAKQVGDKKIQMVSVKELFGLTGYIRGGCSPFAMKKKYPIVVQENILAQDFILVSGGKIGVQIKIAKEDFLKVTNAKIVDVVE